jgi:hypothetical protein
MNSSRNNQDRSRQFRKFLFLFACLATLVGLFYAIENWRGKRAWAKCRSQLEAKARYIDWSSLIPPPIPDAENIFKAPGMEWFVKDNARKTQVTHKPFSNVSRPPKGDTNLVLIAELTLADNNSTRSASTNRVWKPGSQSAQEEALKLTKRFYDGLLPGSQGNFFLFFATDPVWMEPVQISIEADQPPTVNTIRAFFPEDKELPGGTRLRVKADSPNFWQVLLDPSSCISAADYIAWTDQSQGDWDLIRAALNRPQARMESDYQQPFARPIPHFIAVRTIAQVLAQRCQCYLLLGRPEEALRELTLLHDLRRLLDAKPMTLVSAMINVAIQGLYASVVADGLRLHAWKEPQLLAIEKQSAETNLLRAFGESIQTEHAAVCHTLEITERTQLGDLFSFEAKQKWKNPRYWLARWAPRGWLYQNMVSIVSHDEKMLRGVVDPDHALVRPMKESRLRELSQTPYTFLATVALPNYFKAVQTTARNQTLLNEGLIACALERYHQAHKKFPESLETLVPGFLEKIPHDLIGGGSLKYRLMNDGRFLLYSIGWNETDDGGRSDKSGSEGDWVWNRANL